MDENELSSGDSIFFQRFSIFRSSFCKDLIPLVDGIAWNRILSVLSLNVIIVKFKFWVRNLGEKMKGILILILFFIFHLLIYTETCVIGHLSIGYLLIGAVGSPDNFNR